MIRHFFIDKSATIIKGSRANTGLNPILSLNYGDAISRILVHFNEKDVISWINENGITDLTKLTFRLSMTNCSSIDQAPYEKNIVSNPGSVSKRASSFDLQSFALQQHFDAGRGYEYDTDMWGQNRGEYTEIGANWMNSSAKTKWKMSGAYEPDTNLVLQHFDFGNENVSMDITEYVLSVINGSENYGIGIKYDDESEISSRTPQQYVGFFSNNTNTFFHPFIEAIYDEVIDDDREHFVFGKKNKLYLYVNFNGTAVNLDKMPVCTIDGAEFPVKQARKGVYYAEVKIQSKTAGQVLKRDVWSGLSVDGIDIEDVVMEFTASGIGNFLSIGNRHDGEERELIPSIYGINDGEGLTVGEIREVNVDFREKYTTNKKSINHNAEYRIYTKNARRDITVFDYQPVEHAFVKNFFVLNTNDLVPGEYYIDVRVKDNNNLRYYHEVLRFSVVSELKEKYY